MYSDLILLEGEFHIMLDDEGETHFDLEYGNLNLFLGENVALVGGKFLVPVGRFKEAYHPSWINKLPSAPAGFGHHGAGPISEIGL